VLADCIGQRIQCSSRYCSGTIGVYAYTPEVVAEPRLHKSSVVGIQRFAGRAQHLVNNRRNRDSVLSADSPVPYSRHRLQKPSVFCLMLRARLGHTHHLAGHLVGFPLERVFVGADHELGLQRA
jgi:hypothetical protein